MEKAKGTSTMSQGWRINPCTYRKHDLTAETSGFQFLRHRISRSRLPVNLSSINPPTAGKMDPKTTPPNDDEVFVQPAYDDDQQTSAPQTSKPSSAGYQSTSPPSLRPKIRHAQDVERGESCELVFCGDTDCVHCVYQRQKDGGRCICLILVTVAICAAIFVVLAAADYRSHTDREFRVTLDVHRTKLGRYRFDHQRNWRSIVCLSATQVECWRI